MMNFLFNKNVSYFFFVASLIISSMNLSNSIFITYIIIAGVLDLVGKILFCDERRY